MSRANQCAPANEADMFGRGNPICICHESETLAVWILRGTDVSQQGCHLRQPAVLSTPDRLPAWVMPPNLTGAWWCCQTKHKNRETYVLQGIHVILANGLNIQIGQHLFCVLKWCGYYLRNGRLSAMWDCTALVLLDCLLLKLRNCIVNNSGCLFLIFLLPWPILNMIVKITGAD